MWPALLAVSGSRATALRSALVALGVSLLPVVIISPGVYADWLAVVVLPQPLASPVNGSIAGTLERLGAPLWLGLGASALLLVWLAVWVWRRQPSLEGTSGLAIAAALLAFPLSWTGSSVFLLPVFMSRSWRPPLGIAAALLLVPTRFIVAAASASVLIASSYTWVWLLVLADFFPLRAMLLASSPEEPVDERRQRNARVL